MSSDLSSALQKRTPTRMSPQEGKIIAVSPGGRDGSGKLISLEVKAVDRVHFGKRPGTEVKNGDEELIIMKEKQPPWRRRLIRRRFPRYFSL
jgi:co-chaperonin GroES (HSP10)